MSTTVTYKGNILTTISNTTKILETAGTWLEDDITLTDEIVGGSSVISIVDTSDSHGGTIRSITAVDISDTTATAEDVAQGKYFYTSDGTKTLGISSGGGSTPEITISTSGTVSQALQPDTVYHFTSDALTSLTITFAGTATDQYHFDFISPSTAVTLSLPSTVIMPASFGVEVNSKYEIDIYNNYGVYAVWVYEEVSS